MMLVLPRPILVLAETSKRAQLRALGDKPDNSPSVLPGRDQELTVRSSKYMVFDKKSIPMVAC